MVGTATTIIPASMENGRRSPLRPRAAKRASAASGQAVNFMAEAMPKTTPEAKGLSPLRQDDGEEQERHDRDVVAPGRQRQARPAEG